MKAIHQAIIREFRAAHDGSPPKGPAISILWTRREEDGALRFFNLKQSGRLIAIGSITEWGDDCQIDLTN